MGGIGARRAPALLITLIGQLVSLLLLMTACVALHVAMPGRHQVVLAAIGGFEGALALALFYRALAAGAMGLTAALTGLVTALVPVLFSAARYGLPSPTGAAGLACGCAAIWLITHQPAAGGRVPASALLLGALAGAGFGTQLILFKLAEPASFISIMTVARVAGVAALLPAVLVARPRKGERGLRRGRVLRDLCLRDPWLIGVAAGLLDTAGNLFYLGAARWGRLDAAAVICSLYPAGTILLAALVLRERPSLRQLGGMALALAAVGLLSV